MKAVTGPRIDPHREGAVLAVRVHPRARREGISGVHDGALKVALKAPPVDGAANTALIKYLSRLCGVPKGHVRIVAGHTGRQKRVLFDSLDPEALAERVRAALEA